MLKRLFFLLCLPCAFLRAVPMEEASSKFSKGSVPAWVKPCDFAEAPVKPSQINVQQLLDDVQINWEEKTRYVHKVVKILSQAGAEGFTKLSIDFDPSYQSVMVHAIQVLRNGEVIDCLEKSHHKLLQREESLDQNLYEGKLSLVYFLNDIRPGDIFEFSCSIIGESTLWSSHFADTMTLQGSFATVEKIYRRILMHPDTPLQMKQFHTSLQPQVVDLSPSLREWSWEVLETPSLTREDDEPSWYNPLARVQISQYKNWQEVVGKVLPLFTLPEDLKTNASPEMAALVNKWMGSTDDVFQRATFALRFVQDEVKYMGFEDGIGGWKPTDPRVVLGRRFGDCKDKSLLLQALLKLMDIRSTPVLVEAEMGKRLPEVLPAPYFNHVVLRIEINGSHYWVDPTMTYQGGSLATNYFPGYEWGLVVAEGTTELTALPPEIARRPLEIRTSIVFTSPDTAELKIEQIREGSRAEMMRQAIQVVGLRELRRASLEDTQKIYKGASVITPLSIQDDREKNILAIQEHYKISSRTRMGKKMVKVISAVLEESLDDNINLERTSPYALAHPLWVKEHIHIENPFNEWAPDTEEAHYENEVVHFHYAMKKEGQTADFDFELKHLKDHVPVDFIQDYWNLIHEVEPNPSLELIISKS